MSAFNNERYLGAQIESFVQRLNSVPFGGRAIIEFGGKPIDDQHAARVLPGFDPDIKIELLHQLRLVSDLYVVVAVSARDLLRPRIRGDSQLFYGSETIRVIKLLRAKGLHIDTGVVTMVNPELSLSERAVIDLFHSNAIAELGIHFREDQLILQYPDTQAAKWGDWGSVNGFGDDRHHVLVLSPGGGSGKFCLCVAELYRDYRAGRNSTFMKYETFPVFGLRPEHPVNRAFIAATADLGNTLSVETQTGLTCYDKEVGNFALLQRVHQACCPDGTTNPITQFVAPSSMSVNCLLDGFDDEFAIASAARSEIERRTERYRSEIARGIESVSTINHLTTFAAE